MTVLPGSVPILPDSVGRTLLSGLQRHQRLRERRRGLAGLFLEESAKVGRFAEPQLECNLFGRFVGV